MKSLKEKLNGNELDLSLCELTEVPVKDLLALPKATHLDISCNFLLALPVSFSSLTFLIQLDLSKNQLAELPYNFGSLKQLQHLDVYGNQLTSLPVSMCQMKKLRWLDLKNNPLEPKLQTIAGDCLDQKQCQQAATKIVEYLSGINSELEREKQKKLKLERTKEYAKRDKEEKEAEIQRKLKKAEKESKKAEKMKKKLESKNSLQNKNTQENDENFEDDSDVEVKATMTESILYYIKWMIFLIIAMSLILLVTNIYLRFKMGQKLTSLEDVISVSWDEFNKLKFKAINLWHLSSEKGYHYYSMLQAQLQQLYIKYASPTKQSNIPKTESQEL